MKVFTLLSVCYICLATLYEPEAKIGIYVNYLSNLKGNRVDFYDKRLGNCEPSSGLIRVPETLSNVLLGNKITNSNFNVIMKQSSKCQKLCQLTPTDSEWFQKIVRGDFFYNFIVDGLPLISVDSEEGIGKKNISLGVPVSFSEEKQVFLNNHLSFIFEYNEVEKGKLAIVGSYVVASSRKQNTKEDSSLDCEVSDRMAAEGALSQFIITYDVTWRESKKNIRDRNLEYSVFRSRSVQWFKYINLTIACFGRPC